MAKVSRASAVNALLRDAKTKNSDFEKMSKNLVTNDVHGLLEEIALVRRNAGKEITAKIRKCNAIEKEFGMDSDEWRSAFVETAKECNLIWDASEAVVKMIGVIMIESDEHFDLEKYLQSEAALGVKKEIDHLLHYGEKTARTIMRKFGRPEEAPDLLHDALIKIAESGYDRTRLDKQKSALLSKTMNGLAIDKYTSKNCDFLFSQEGKDQKKPLEQPIRTLSLKEKESVESILKEREQQKTHKELSQVKTHSADELKKWKEDHDARLRILMESLGQLRYEDEEEDAA